MTTFLYNMPTVCKLCAFLNNADSGSDTEASNSLYIILLSWNHKFCIMICQVNIFIVLICNVWDMTSFDEYQVFYTESFIL